MAYRVPAVFFLLLLALSCGTVTSGETEDAVTDPYGDPPGYSGDPFAGYGPVTSITLPAQGGEETEPGGRWSVQVAACATMESAESLRASVEADFQEPVFIDHIGSYYKVRVGSFDSAESSAELRGALRGGGYPDAWSVERELTP